MLSDYRVNLSLEGGTQSGDILQRTLAWGLQSPMHSPPGQLHLVWHRDTPEREDTVDGYKSDIAEQGVGKLK